MEVMDIGSDTPPGMEPWMYEEWQAWQRVVDALKHASASIDINEEPILAAAIEMWGEVLTQLRFHQPEQVCRKAFDDKITVYNELLR